MEHSEERRSISRKAHEAVRDEFNAESFSRRVFELVSHLSGAPAGDSRSAESI